MAEVYIHPQQRKLIRIENGLAVAYSRNSLGTYQRGRSSATTEKLRGGYGRWVRDDSQNKCLPYFPDKNGNNVNIGKSNKFFSSQTVNVKKNNTKKSYYKEDGVYRNADGSEMTVVEVMKVLASEGKDPMDIFN